MGEMQQCVFLHVRTLFCGFRQQLAHWQWSVGCLNYIAGCGDHTHSQQCPTVFHSTRWLVSGTVFLERCREGAEVPCV